MESERRKDVAVLGGGVGGMTAAYELSKTDELRRRFKVTVYQLGWRLGGKGASGRNAAMGQRIEEHGLHLWFGFYTNAFRMMGKVYEDLERPPGAKLQTVREAFSDCPEVALWDQVSEGDWRRFGGRAPVLGDPPWVDQGRSPTALDLARKALDWAESTLTEISGMADAPPVSPDVFRRLEEAREKVDGGIAQAGIGLDLVQGALGAAVAAAEVMRDLLHSDWERVLYGAEADTRSRVIFGAVDLMVATFKGIHDDRILYEGIRVIDHLDWRRWLARHGARPITVGTSFRSASPVLRAIYDVAFCFPGGNVDAASAAAGTAMSDLMRLGLDYRGAIAYKMNAGMGDAIFAPLYELLDDRGVEFKFFHAVTDLRASADGRWIDEIEVVPQLGRKYAHLKYEPLVDVDGLPSWPNQPLDDQGLPDFAIGSERVLETSLDPFGKRAEAIRLTRRDAAGPGASDGEFDKVVLAIPVGALPAIAPDLMRRRAPFAQMVGRGAKDTVATQAFQLWTTETPEALGVESARNSVTATFVEPLDTYCDMGQTLETEEHPPEVKGVGYVCGVLPEVPGESPADSRSRVKRAAIEYVERDLGRIWKDHEGSPWDAIHDPDGRTGRDRFDAQYWRANVAPWDRYVITPAGNVATRLRSGASGFGNLAMAGDWTENVINGGCVEAAVISGRQAARELTGEKFEIEGEDPRWLTPPELREPKDGQGGKEMTGAGGGSLPAYEDFGGRSSFPGPFHCVQGDMRMFVLPGRMEKIRAIVERMLNGPANEAVEYRPVLPFVLFMHGLNVVSSKVPPWDEFGQVNEILAAFWVPVLAGKSAGGRFRAEKLCMSLPYILVDNPISHYAGREIYGFPKALGRFTGRADEILIQGYGGDFASNSIAGWFDFVQTKRAAAGAATAGVPSAGSEDEIVELLAADATSELGDVDLSELEYSGELAGRGLDDIRKLLHRILGDFRKGTMNQVFLKQFRDAEDHSLAVYQAVVEAPAHTRSVKFDVEPGIWRLEIANKKSHPIGDELGLDSQWAGFSVRIRDFEFDVDPGKVVAP